MAANLAVISLGTDTGGSIRQPGSFCGVPALNPSYGRVSRYGLIAYASSLDRIGPFAHTVATMPRVMSVIAGRDRCDATSSTAPVPDYAAGLDRPLHGLRMGIPDDYFGEGIDPEVRQKIEAGIRLLEKLGCKRVSIRMPNTDYAIAAYYILATAEASSIWRATTACASARVSPDRPLSRCIKKRAGAALARK